MAPDAKPDARAKAVAAAPSGQYGNRELTIRCNGLDTQWGADDLAALARPPPSAVVIPKVDSVDVPRRGLGATRCRRRAGDR